MTRLILALLILPTSFLALSPAALADGSERFETTMGFSGGQRSLSSIPFKLTKGDSTALAAGQVLRTAPFDSIDAMGLRYDLRLVISYVRMTLGVDIPFTRQDAQRIHVGDHEGTALSVVIEDIDPVSLRFGLGGEYGFELGSGPKRVSPFVDLMGNATWTSVSARVDGLPAEFDSTTFDFTMRGGVRMDLTEYFFLQLAAEVGLIGDIQWGAELSVGFALR